MEDTKPILRIFNKKAFIWFMSLSSRQLRQEAKLYKLTSEQIEGLVNHHLRKVHQE